MERSCQLRQKETQATKPEKPASVIAFCDALQRQRQKNLEDRKGRFQYNRYYAYHGGLEWSHGYYGARQFWTDEWDEETGWEVRTANLSVNWRDSAKLLLLSAVMR